MDVVLCTNNKYEDPFLHSQLLKIYDEISYIDKKYLFCRNKGKKDTENIINIDYGKISFFIYFFKLLVFVLNVEPKKNIFHIRGYVSGFIFYFVQLLLFWKKINYIYDPRGAFITELKESKFFNNENIILKILKIIEKKLIKNSIQTIVTTNKFKNFYIEEYSNESKYLTLYNTSAITSEDLLQKDLNTKKSINICYIGSIDYWHDLDEIIRVLKYTQDIIPVDSKVYFFTNYSNKKIIEKKLNIANVYNFVVKFIPYEEVAKNLKKMDICVSIVKPTKSQLIASPIKISDYIQLNKIIISNLNIGDFDEYFISNNSVKLYEYGKKLTYSFVDLQKLNLEKNVYFKNKLSIVENINKINKLLYDIIEC